MATRFAVALLLLVFPPVFIEGQTAPAESQVRETLARFIKAFDDLDWDTFRLSFDDNATVFYPRGFPRAR